MGILANINLPADVEKCVLMEKTTGFYIDMKNYVDWLSNDVGISLNSSVPSWKLETDDVSTTTTTTEPKTTPGAAVKISYNLISIIFALIMKYF